MTGTSSASMRWFAIAALLLALGGCSRIFSSNCNKPAAYANAQSVPLLQVPAGLDSPDRRAALKIPELNQPEARRVKGDPCLDEPPKYSNANLATAAPGAAGRPAAPAAKKHWWSRK
jgi:uncharacterized lipoprotein